MPITESFTSDGPTRVLVSGSKTYSPPRLATKVEFQSVDQYESGIETEIFADTLFGRRTVRVTADERVTYTLNMPNGTPTFRAGFQKIGGQNNGWNQVNLSLFTVADATPLPPGPELAQTAPEIEQLDLGGE